MTYLLGVDTGGTYTDAVILDEANDTVIASAKALTSRPDLAIGVGSAIDAALASSAIDPISVAMVSLSTTLATNALVEGQGGRVALVFIGFDPAELGRAGLEDALRGDPVISLAGGHSHAGAEVAPLDLDALATAVHDLDAGVTAFAIAASFATRNAAHEIAARDMIREATGKPVTCSHELSSALGGPKRALTAVLNARLIGMIDGLIGACENHLEQVGIDARLMVVRGDGALVSADVAREKPIETILSGPAASIAGASWLTGENDALVSDIGGTTTDVCLLQGGRPKIDPHGARVGPYRTMVEAVAMRTTGLGGDSEVHVVDGLGGGLRLGPRRLMPISLAAQTFPELVHRVLDRCLASDIPPSDGGRFAIPMFKNVPEGLDTREASVAARLIDGPLRQSEAAPSRMETPALMRLVTRGMVMIAGVTPSDASHVLERVDAWDRDAAVKAIGLFARRRTGAGERLADSPESMAQAIIDQLTRQTVDCLLQAAFDEDGWDNPDVLASHPLTIAGLEQRKGIVETDLRLSVPVIGLGASAGAYYGAVGARLNTAMVLPKHADVANAIGAVVGQVAMHASGAVTSPGAGSFAVHLPAGLRQFETAEKAMDALEFALRAESAQSATAAGVEEIRFTVEREINQVDVEGQPMFIDATVKVTAQGTATYCSFLGLSHDCVMAIARMGVMGDNERNKGKVMLDSYARKLIDPPLNKVGRIVAARGISANDVTLIGLVLGLVAALCIACGAVMIALLPLLASRVADGLDGAVARATRKTDFGGYLDIAADFLFYGAIPAAFVFADPAVNGAAGAFLLAAFYFNGTSFLGYAILAEKHGDQTDAQGQKSLYYSNGILEGTETIAFFVLLCLFPAYFVPMAYVFGALCFVTATLRIYSAKKTYSD